MTQKAVSLSDSVLQISKDLKSLIDEYVGEELKNHSLIEDKYNHLVSFLKEERPSSNVNIMFWSSLS